MSNGSDGQSVKAITELIAGAFHFTPKKITMNNQQKINAIQSKLVAIAESIEDYHSPLMGEIQDNLDAIKAIMEQWTSENFASTQQDDGVPPPLFKVKYCVLNSQKVTAEIRLYLPRAGDAADDLPNGNPDHLHPKFRALNGVAVLGESPDRDWGFISDRYGKYRSRCTNVTANSWEELDRLVTEIKGEIPGSLRSIASEYRSLTSTQPEDLMEEIKL